MKSVAVLELLLATAFWGFGFVATVWVMPPLNAFELTLLRFILTGIFGLPWVIRLARTGFSRELARLSFMPGVLLTSTLILQTWGLEYTTPTKSAFITTLYVVFVPLVELAVARKAIGWSLWTCVGMALVGTALMVDLGFSSVNIGDVLTFICALTCTAQIHWMGKVSPRLRQPFTFNIYQCLWSIPMSLPFVTTTLWKKVVDLPNWPPKAILGLISLSFGSTVLAFFLQVKAQAKLSPTVSSLLFLMESPFALVFSLLLLGKSLAMMESIGAVLIFGSALWATRIEVKR